MSDDYDVGYGKPPKHTQFQPGQSGNPRGRKPGNRNFKTDLTEELQTAITVREGGTVKSVTKQQALIKRAMEAALKGDPRAIHFIVSAIAKFIGVEDTTSQEMPLTREDRAILARYGLTPIPSADETEDTNHDE